MDKKKFSTFSYNLVQISPIMILVNSGAFLSISSWFSELTELIFVMIPYISSTGYPPNNARDYGSCASSEFDHSYSVLVSPSLEIELNMAASSSVIMFLSDRRLKSLARHYCSKIATTSLSKWR